MMSTRLRYLPVITVACVGVWLSFLAYGIVAESEEVVVEHDLSQVARRIAALLRRGLDEHRFELMSLQAFHAASEKVTRNEFGKYVKSTVGGGPAVKCIQWIPRVPRSRLRELIEEAGTDGFPNFKMREKDPSGRIVPSPPRDEYFPVYYVEPLSCDQGVIGMDLGTEPGIAPYLKRARETGRIVATGRDELPCGDRDQAAFRLIVPVYANAAEAGPPEQRRRSLKGFYSAIYSLEEFVDRSLARDIEQGIDVHIFDESLSPPDSLLCSRSFPAGRKPSAGPRTQATLLGGLYEAVTLDVGQRKWRVIAKPTPQFLAARHTWHAWMALLAGLLATGLFSGYLVMIQRGAERSRQFAASQLQAKQDLEKEIGERKSAEKALQESEARYKSLFEDSPISLWDQDFSLVVEWMNQMRSQGVMDFRSYYRDHPEAVAHCAELVKVLDVNKATVAMLGAGNKVPLLTGGLPMVLSEDLLEMFREELIALAGGAPRFESETVLQTLTGEEKRVNLCLNVAPGYEESLGRVLVSLLDITERKKAEEALRESEEKYRTLFEQSRDAIFVAGRTGIIIDANRSCEELFGAARDEIIGSHTLEFYENPEEHARYLKELDRNGFVRDWESRVRRKDNVRRVCLLTSSLWKEENGSILGYLTIVRDVTDSRQLEEQLQQAQKMESLGTITGGIAHDFNNLLQVVGGYADVALFGLKEGDKWYPEFLEIRNAAKSGAELTQGLLTFSRRVESNLRPVDINVELHQVAKMLERTIPKMIGIEMNLAHGLPTILADPAQLQQTFLNLAVNARDSMPQGGTLSIETEEADFRENFCIPDSRSGNERYIRISVSDNGSGMDKQTVERIFDPFFTTKEAGKGTGLGLSIAYGIVKSHGGTIVCDSEPGWGTTFRIYLPATNSVPEIDGETKEKFVGGSETILLVDDEDAVRELGENMLTSFGYQVLSAANGFEGLEIFTQNKDRISLCILDLMMPEMDGKECLKRILSLEPKAKVLIATGYDSNGFIEHALEHGAKGSLRKPYGTGQLLEVVRRVLDERCP